MPTGVSVLESANSELESADSSANSNADPSKIGVWVRACRGVHINETVLRGAGGVGRGHYSV